MGLLDTRQGIINHFVQCGGCSSVVEHSVVVRAVAGSIPVSRPIVHPNAGVAELVDALVLGTSVVRRGGSSPSARTTFLE